MMGWSYRPFGELIESLDARRQPVKEADRRPGPYPYYGASGVVDHVDGYLFEGLHLLVAEDGENLRTRKLPIAFLADGRFWVNNHAHVVRGNAHADTRFLSYALMVADVASYLSGSTMPKLTQGNLHRVPIYAPELGEQIPIADTLASMDHKIDLNRRTSETLEAMAQAIFRDWFVDFGPVRRKLAGETDPVTIMGGLTPDPARSAELATLFPSALDDRDVPQGWVERPLDQIAEFLNGLALQKFPAVEGEPSLPVIKIAELRNGLTEKSNRASTQLPGKYIVRDGDYLFSWSGSLMAKVWTEGDGALNQHLFKVSSTSYPQWFFAAWVEHHLPEFQRIAASKATTMGHIQRGHLTSAMTVCPPRPTLEVMATVLAPLWERRIHNDLENRTLAETRDYLLPRLMSGAVRVGRAETKEAAA